MTNNNLNERLISSIRSSLTKEENMVQVLMDILLIGKESAYRRIRGEVPFTFEEVAKISAKLGFSIDNTLGITNSARAVFDLGLMDPKNLTENYCDNLERYIRLFRKMRKGSYSIARVAINTLPYSFYLPHENLAKFKLYRWLYQLTQDGAPISYSKLEVPQRILDLQKIFVAENRYIKKAFFILDRNVFTSMKYDIEYFYRLRLISKEDVLQLKEELFHMLDDLEGISVSGNYKSGGEVSLYISNVNLETSYSHYESDDIGCSYLRVFSINNIDSQNPTVCEKQKEWIESLKRYSTLITQSGEMQRFEYFQQQRDEIRNITV